MDTATYVRVQGSASYAMVITNASNAEAQAFSPAVAQHVCAGIVVEPACALRAAVMEQLHAIHAAAAVFIELRRLLHAASVTAPANPASGKRLAPLAAAWATRL